MRVSNTEWQQLRSCYSSTDLPHARCPSLDSVFKTSLAKSTEVKAVAKSTEVKAVDKELARAQAHVLDTIDTALHKDKRQKLRTPYKRCRKDSARSQLEITSLHMAMGQKCILTCFNPKMQDIAEEQELFQSAASLQLGQGFESKMKEQLESLKILSSCSHSRNSSFPP